RHGTTTTRAYPLTRHDALPISRTGGGSFDLLGGRAGFERDGEIDGLSGHHDDLAELFLEVRVLELHVVLAGRERDGDRGGGGHQDRKSTRLHSSHVKVSYAVLC